MENYIAATKYAEVATDSLGTSQEKYAEYLDSIDAKMNALTAQFESFSQTLLNSSWAKDIISEVTNLVKWLEKFVSIGDGVLLKVTAITASVIALYAIIKRIKSLKIVSTLSSLPKILAIAKLHIQNLGVTSFLTSEKIGILSRSLKALKLDPVVLGITAAIAVFASLVKILDYASEAAIRSSEASIKNAQTAKSTADAIREEKDSLDDLIDSYEQIAKENMDDAASREEALKIQQQIVELAGDEANGLDLINGKLDERLEKLRKIRLAEASSNSKTSQESYEAAEDAAKNALYSDMADAPWLSESIGKGLGYSIAVKTKAWDAADVLRDLDDRIKIGLMDGQIVEGWLPHTSMYFDAEGADEYYDLINKSIEALKSADDGNYDTATQELYSKLISAREYYSGLMTAAADEAKKHLSNLIEVADGALNTDISSIDSLEDFEKFKQSLVESVSETDDAKKMLEKGRITQDDISNAVEKYMMAYYDGLYAEVTKASKSAGNRLLFFNEILEELQPGFDAYSAAMSDMSEYGYLQADTLSTLLELFPTLEDKLEMTANGYKIATDELDKWIDSQREAYVAALANAKTDEEKRIARENLRRFLAVEATLKMSDAIEKETKALEDQQEALEKELDAHKKLVDIRKELLETFKEEKDYQDELEKKQRNVARLQTSLTVARLDTSAAGQARVRELEQELQEAQDDLDDFTLEHAIEVLMGQLDKEYNEHEQQVNSQISAINDAKEAIAGQIGSLNQTVDGLLKKYLANNPKVDNGTELEGEFTGPPAPPAKEPIGPPAPSYLNPLDEQRTNLQNYINERGYSSVNANEWAKDYTFGEMLTSYVKSGGALDDLFDIRGRKWGVPSFHTGGFVGDIARLQSNEEFAKLLRGEFVSTPRQMDNFMRKILPEVASFGSNGVNEFNAPLISIECENVTQESLPKLQDIVNKAVATIQRQLNDGMSRSGYKQNINKKQFI